MWGIAMKKKVDEDKRKILKYATELRSMTQGRGRFDMELVRYEEVPGPIAEKIIAEAKKEAEEIYKKVKAGEDFATLAKEYSQDEYSAVNGGDLGFFEKGQMVPEFEKAAFSLEENKVSELVETSYGYHIMYFVKNNGYDWETTALSKLQEEAYSDAFEAIMGTSGKYSMVKNEKNIAKVSEDFCDKIRQSLAQQASQKTVSL